MCPSKSVKSVKRINGADILIKKEKMKRDTVGFLLSMPCIESQGFPATVPPYRGHTAERYSTPRLQPTKHNKKLPKKEGNTTVTLEKSYLNIERFDRRPRAILLCFFANRFLLLLLVLCSNLNSNTYIYILRYCS